MKLIILDRDGVINYESPTFVKSPAEWLPISESLAAIAKLKQAGFTIAIATNQSGIARGLYDETMLASIHQKMQTELAVLNTKIDKIEFCPHDDSVNCDCRKPKPGMLVKICQFYAITPKQVCFIGDSYRDVLAALAIGCQPILVKSGFGQDTLAKHPELLEQIPVYQDLSAVVMDIITNKKYYDE